jgi:RHS repeat-associated protein
VNKYEYDALGNVKKEYFASGLVTEYAYNPDNEPVNVVKKALSGLFGMSYEYDAFGNITKITDPLKRVTSIKWTKGFFNRMEEVTDPSGNTIKLGYDETGRLISKADRNNNGWSYTYDPLGRLTAVEDPAKSKMLAQYDLAGNIISQTDFDGVKKEFEYDDLDRITAIVTEGRTDRKVEYDLAGRAIRVIDANGNATAYKYNKIGKVIEMADAEGAITRYAYDKMGRVCSVTDGNGNTTNYAYNKLGRIGNVTDPLGRKTAYSYDPSGRVSEKTLADGSKITYTYDEFGRAAKITYPDDEVVYTYDAVGNVLSAKNSTTNITRMYDALNRVIDETDSYTHKKIAYSYDPEGNRTALVLDEGYKVSYAYDALNRLSQINQGEESFKYNYTPGGRLLSKLYPNNTAQNNSYNKYGQLEKIEITGPGNKAIDSFRYTYDFAGNIVKEENPGTAKEYSYDRIYRLIAEKSGAVTSSYSYDPAGNRVKEITGGKEIAYTYDVANQLIRRGGAEYKYDALGNLIKDDRAEYTYNRRNLMTGARVGLSDITYKYDPFGRRIARNNTGYIYDSFSVIRESTTGFIGKHQVSYLLGARLDEILSRRASPVVYYYQDSLGSIRGLTDSSSKLIQTYDYTAFGQDELSSRSKQFLLLDRKISQPYGFTGRPREDLTGLYYYRYRDYSPETGRFLQPDPLGQLPGPNIYSYCSNNPVNWVDPWGMECENRESDTIDDIQKIISVLAEQGIYVNVTFSGTLPGDTSIGGIDFGDASITGSINNLPSGMELSGPSFPINMNVSGISVQGVAFTATHIDTDISTGNQGNFTGGESTPPGYSNFPPK